MKMILFQIGICFGNISKSIDESMIRMFNARNMQLESDLVLVAGRAYSH